MRRNNDFHMQEIEGMSVIVPMGTVVKDFPGLITVSESGGFLWKLLEKEQTLQSMVEALFEEYDAPKEQILSDVTEFVRKLKLAGALIEENI